MRISFTYDIILIYNLFLNYLNNCLSLFQYEVCQENNFTDHSDIFNKVVFLYFII